MFSLSHKRIEWQGFLPVDVNPRFLLPTKTVMATDSGLRQLQPPIICGQLKTWFLCIPISEMVTANQGPTDSKSFQRAVSSWCRKKRKRLKRAPVKAHISPRSYAGEIRPFTPFPFADIEKQGWKCRVCFKSWTGSLALLSSQWVHLGAGKYNSDALNRLTISKNKTVPGHRSSKSTCVALSSLGKCGGKQYNMEEKCYQPCIANTHGM